VNGFHSRKPLCALHHYSCFIVLYDPIFRCGVSFHLWLSRQRKPKSCCSNCRHVRTTLVGVQRGFTELCRQRSNMSYSMCDVGVGPRPRPNARSQTVPDPHRNKSMRNKPVRNGLLTISLPWPPPATHPIVPRDVLTIGSFSPQSKNLNNRGVGISPWMFSSAAGGAYWPIAIRCPSLPLNEGHHWGGGGCTALVCTSAVFGAF
jgi:hypothetical protein